MAIYDVEDWSSESQIAPAAGLAPSDLTVDAAAQRIAGLTGQLSIALLADPGNGGTVYVAASSGVTSSSWPLAAGAYLSMDTSADVWVIGSASGQVLHVIQATA